jgi:peptidyl-prolyl cis-trans isomerase SurA
MLSQRYVMSVSRERKPPPVSEEEIREFFEANRASVGRLPRSINFRQVVLPVQASDSVRLALRARADSLVALAREGQDFAELARRNSQDPSSAAQGGELGFFRIGDMVPAFEQAVFSPIARTGEIIGPVETEFGLHIIRLERIRGSERSARHILLRPAITEEDSERAQQRAEEVAAAVRAGADVDSLARLHAVTDVPVRVGPMPVDSLAPEYTTELATAQEGDVVGPFAADRDGPTPRWVVLRVTSVQPEREATLDDLRSYIQQRIAETKQTEEIIRDLRRQSYVEVRLGQDPGGGGAL